MCHTHEKAALKILDWFHRAEHDLVGAHIVTSGGVRGYVADLRLDDHHGLCFKFEKHERWYPVSTIRKRS